MLDLSRLFEQPALGLQPGSGEPTPDAVAPAEGAGLGVVDGDSSAIELQGEDLRRFHFRFKTALANAETQMRRIHEEARRDRKVYRTIPREPLYEGGPDITTPLSADFTDGLRAHVKDAMEQRPIASFTAEGVGRVAEEATEVAPVYEAMFEREVNLSNSRQYLVSDMPDEAIKVGTAIAKLGLSEHHGELFVQVSRLIRLENFFVDRVTVNDLTDTFCAYRFKERYYNLQDMAGQGLLNKAAVESLSGKPSSTEQEVVEEGEQEFNENLAFQEENSLYTIHIGYMRFRPLGSSRALLYECIYHKDTHRILALKLNPARAAFDAPPLRLARIGREPGFLFGRGVVRRLESEQKVADRGINTHLAMNDLAAAPPVMYNVNNPIAARLAQNRVLEPAMWVPNYGPPDSQDILPVQIPNNGLAAADYQMALGMAQRRTYTDESMGTSSSTRKTLGQYRTEVNKGTLKLRLDLNDLAYDMNEILRSYWAMIIAYKIDPAGIYQAEPMGRLVGDREYSAQEFAAAFIEEATTALVQGEITLEDIASFDEMLQDVLTHGRIPSVRRRDLVLSLTGTKVIADKIGDLEMELQLMPMLLNVLEGAMRDTYINYWGRSILRNAGFKDIEKRWPQDPGIVMANPAERMVIMQQLNEIVQRSSTRF